jgi:hypothetical protein
MIMQKHYYGLVYTFFIYTGLLLNQTVGTYKVHAAFEKVSAGAAPAALGNAITAGSNSPYAIYYNTAGIADIEKFQIIFSISSIFELKDLYQTDIIVNFPVVGHGVSVALNRLGNSLYQEVQLTAASKYEIVQKGALGLSVQYYSLSIKNYGNDSAIGISVSFLYDLSQEYSVGAMITNINKPRLGQIGEKLPQTINLGLSFTPSENLGFYIDSFHDSRFKNEIRAGFLFRPVKLVRFRAGIEDAINTYSFGIGFKSALIDFDYAIQIHSFLGPSHVISLELEF